MVGESGDESLDGAVGADVHVDDRWNFRGVVWAQWCGRRHTCEVRQTVRQRLQGMTGTQVAIAVLGVITVLVAAGAILASSSGDESIPVAPPSSTLAVEATVLDFEPAEGASGDASGSSVTTMIAGFGMLGLWILAGGVTLGRAHRRRTDDGLGEA
jgi:hypothetical protein